MFDTYVTLVGNALSAPEARKTRSSNTTVVNFRIASTSRRYDKASGAWVDGDSLRVKVACWRRLGENVLTSVYQGDPLIVTGRMYSRDYTTEQGEKRVAYELDAVAVGHDLSRGVGRFSRTRRTPTDMVADGKDDGYVAGEPTVPLTSRPTSPVGPAIAVGSDPAGEPTIPVAPDPAEIPGAEAPDDEEDELFGQVPDEPVDLAERYREHLDEPRVPVPV